MNVLQAYLDNREDRPAQRELDAWMLPQKAPEVRLLAFDAWIRAELLKRMVWPSDPAMRSRLVEQCRIELDKPVLELWRRGWMLDGARLAAHLRKLLDAVGSAQRAGRVNDFWPYFRSAVRRYVGVNAEEIQLEARSLGAQMSKIISGFGVKAEAPSLPELIAQRRSEITEAKSLREKIAIARKRRAAADDTLPLL